MAKSTLTDAVRWFDSIVDRMDVPALEQAVMYAVINYINKNIWRRTAISLSKLSAKLCSDKRTVKKAVDYLVTLGLLSVTKTDKDTLVFEVMFDVNGGDESNDDVNDTGRVPAENAAGREDADSAGEQTLGDKSENSILKLLQRM